MYKSYIMVKHQYEGFHSYAGAPPEVKFLADTHRHLFKVDVTIEVGHDDREIEFMMVQRRLKTAFPDRSPQAELGSCEQQAKRIIEFLRKLYGDGRTYMVKVSEDGENAGLVQWLVKS